MLKSDVFGGAERISRDHFMTIRGDLPDKNAFWRVVSQIAVEKFNMQEAFNMRSTGQWSSGHVTGQCSSGHALCEHSTPWSVKNGKTVHLCNRCRSTYIADVV